MAARGRRATGIRAATHIAQEHFAALEPDKAIHNRLPMTVGVENVRHNARNARPGKPCEDENSYPRPTMHNATSRYGSRPEDEKSTSS